MTMFTSGCLKCPANQGAHGLSAIAVPLMLFKHAVSDFHQTVDGNALESSTTEQGARLTAKTVPQVPAGVSGSGIEQRVQKKLLRVFIIQRRRPVRGKRNIEHSGQCRQVINLRLCQRDGAGNQFKPGCSQAQAVHGQRMRRAFLSTSEKSKGTGQSRPFCRSVY